MRPQKAFTHHIVSAAAGALFTSAIGATGCVSTTDRARFASPEEATNALVQALRTGDRERTKQILGPEADAIYSDDPIADREHIGQFVGQYEQGHKFVELDADSVALTVGNAQWPMPIPLVRSDGAWVFATEDGIDEMVSRRIGRNELDAYQVILAIVDAQREYAETDADRDGVANYAFKFLSDEGSRNGLSFKTAPNELMSPLGELIASASEEGYRPSPTSGPTPYHGYYYRMLTAQGPNAAGGERNYIMNGKLIGGFGVVAWPAAVGDSGIATFIVNQDGLVYERYLGTSTDEIARSMRVFDPGPGWKRAR